MREILTRISTSAGSNKLAVMYFDELTAIADQRAALNVFWTAVKTYVTAQNRFTVANQGRIIDPATGALTGQWSGGVETAIVGSSAGNSNPDAAQVLMRWRTGVVQNGRFVNGRTFIPGLAGVEAGNVPSSVVSALAAAGNTLAGSGAGFGIWHRPKNGAGGTFEEAISASVWSEFAVLRRRRG